MRGKMIIQITSSDFFKIFVGPFFVGLTSYILIAKCDEWKTRKKQSKIGVSIIDSLIEEVNTGIRIFYQFNNQKDLPTAYLPNKSWSGISTTLQTAVGLSCWHPREMDWVWKRIRN